MTDESVTPLSKTSLSALMQNFFTEGFIPRELAAIDRRVSGFMKKYRVPGMSMAITRNGQLVYAKGFGVAQKLSLWDFMTFQSAEPVDLWYRFRIASVSKPITAVAIFKLIEEGKLSLTAKVFGPGGVFGTDFGFDTLLPGEANTLAQITVQHLLEHASGGWPNDDQDPMFVQPELTHQQLIAWALHNRVLNHNPGTIWSYSNFGFCLLGRIIERISGQPYADYVRANVLAPCGITTMEIAGDTLDERRAGEVVYYGQPYDVTVSSGGGAPVNITVDDDPYAIPVARMDSHGGWIASAVDLVRFAVNVDNFPQPTDILSAASIATMTTPTTARTVDGSDPRYAKGWFLEATTVKQDNWYHNGSLPGTLSFLLRSYNGFCWAALMNTRVQNSNSQMVKDLEKNVMWPLLQDAKVVSQWPTHDLFPTYDDPWKSLKVVYAKKSNIGPLAPVAKKNPLGRPGPPENTDKSAA